jgi:hypothetical protein
VLGRFQDSEAQREAIYALAADMMASGDAEVGTILAMGEIAARQQEAMHTARAEFAAAFASFGRLPVGRRLARLTPAPTGAALPAGPATVGAAR